MIGWGEFFALGAALSWAFAIILFRRAGDALPPFELNLFKNLLGFSLILPTLAILEGFQLSAFTPQEVGVLLLSGFLGFAVADTWYLRALSLMGAGRTGIVASLLSPFVILLSIVFLGESLQGWQLPGFAMVMGGILLVTWRQNRREVDTEHLGKGVFYGVGSMLMLAISIVMVKEILGNRPFLWTTELRLAGGIGGMVIYAALRGGFPKLKQRFSQPLPWRYILPASFLGAFVSMMMWLAGYKLIPASQASVLNQTANAWIVLLAWLMLGEPINPRKLSGILLTSAGVVIMLLA